MTVNLDTITDMVDKAIVSFLPESTVYDRSKSITQLGLDQLQLLQLRNRLSQELSYELYPAFFHQYATADEIIQFFVDTKLHAFKDWIYETEWQSTAIPEIQELKPNNVWLIFTEIENEISPLLVATLHEHRQKCILVQPGKSFQKLGDDHFIINPHNPEDFVQLLSHFESIAQVVYFWGYEPIIDTLKQFHKKAISGLLYLANHCAHLQNCRLWVVTDTTLTDGTGESLAEWPLAGLCKIIREEYPGLSCSYVAMDSTVSPAEVSDALFCELASATNEPEIAYRNGNRLVARMIYSDVKEIKIPQFSEDKTYIIAGAFGELGSLLASWYRSKGAKHLILLDEILAKFDDETTLRKIFAKIRQEHPPIGGVMYAAGVVDNDLMLNMTWENFEEIYRLKVAGSWNLHLLTESDDLDHFILFSSCLPDLAPLGKANHAVGNSFLDALAHYRKMHGRKALSLDWGPRDLRHVQVRQTAKTYDTKGLTTLKLEEIFQVLESLFYSNTPQIAVANIHWSEMLQGQAQPNPLFDEIATEIGFKRVPILNDYIKATPALRKDLLQKYIHEEVRRVLHLQSSHKLELRRSFNKMAMDALAMNILRNRIQRDFHEVLNLPINFVEAHSTIEELSDALGRMLQKVVEPVDKMPTSKIEIDLHEPIAITGASVRFAGNVTTLDNFWTMMKAQVDTVGDVKNIDPSVLAWEALEDAGIAPDAIKNSKTGLFIGAPPENVVEIAKTFELYGPCISTDSSLISVDLACEKLRLGICDLALAGGINRVAEESTDKRCRSLDAQATGTVITQGAALVVLKRLSDAEKDNDNIIAVIRGVSSNREGSIQAALKNAQVKSSDVYYIEVEGVGTIEEDAKEINSLSTVYAEARSKKNPLFVGSVKTNVGNSLAASGIAGLIKCALALKNDEIPPQLHFTELNPLIEEGRKYIKVVADSEPFPDGFYAAVNGASHIILQKAPKRTLQQEKDKNYIVTLSAKTAEDLDRLIEKYKAFLPKSTASIGQIAYTSNMGRVHFDYRAAIVAKSVKELKLKLQNGDFVRGQKGTIDSSLPIEEQYVEGASIDWQLVYEGVSFIKTPLPTYPFSESPQTAKPFTQAKVTEAVADALSDNVVIIHGDRRSESDLARIKELKENRHINTMIVIYK